MTSEIPSFCPNKDSEPVERDGKEVTATGTPNVTREDNMCSALKFFQLKGWLIGTGETCNKCSRTVTDSWPK